MKTKLIYFALSYLLLTVAAGCEDKVNDWSVDAGQDGLFRSLTFEEKELKATSLTISYTQVVNATDYIFEFSEDSLLFTNITRVDTILADTLTPYSKSTSQMKTEFRTIFSDLKGITRYSVRMKAISRKSGRESGYVSFFFQTPEEQVFSKAIPEIDRVTLLWEEGTPLTHVMLWERNELNELLNPVKYDLAGNPAELGGMQILGLSGGTSYTAQAFDGETKRGEIQFRTMGIQNSEVVYVTPEDTITYLLQDCAIRKVTDVSLMFMGGKVYDSGSITLPAGIENLVFVGKASDTGELPDLKIPAISFSEQMKTLAFENVGIDGQRDAKNYLFSIGDSKCFGSISFKGCRIKGYNRSVVRFNVDNLEVESVIFDDCLISDVGQGGYGLIVFGKAQKNVGLVAITNSTLTEVGSLMQLNDGTKKVLVDRCIVYNNTFGAGNFFRLDKQPGEIAVTNTIFAGPNGGKKLNATYGNYATYFSFFTSYVTKDMQTDKYPFKDASVYEGTSADLFEDAPAGDFHLKATAKFPGKEAAGDPRWW